jgi:uncharacterized membrane protein (DUF106 family)
MQVGSVSVGFRMFVAFITIKIIKSKSQINAPNFIFIYFVCQKYQSFILPTIGEKIGQMV